MSRAALVFVLSITVLLVLAGSAFARVDPAEMTTGAAIEDAYERGVIDRAEMILQKAYFIYAPWNLSEEFRGGQIDKCGTPIVEEIDAALATLPVEVADEIRRLRVRPTCHEYIDTEHFRLHYNTYGTHKILDWPNTAYRDSTAAALEYSWTQEVDVLGLRQPPSDGGDPDGGGGSGHYDCYVQALSGYYGYCQGCYTVPSTPQRDCTSFIVIDNDYAGFGYPDPVDPMRVTVAHEFSHGCQNAHDYQEDVWYKECTSMWCEDYVYDYVDDYVNYIPYYYNSPHRSLDWDDATGLRKYGTLVWNMYLAQNHGASVIRDIWVSCEAYLGTFDAIDIALGPYGTDIEVEFSSFATWNFFTAGRDDGNHYEEGATWCQVAMTRQYYGYPIVDGAPYSTYRPDHMAANYIKFNNSAPGWTGLRIAYDGPWPGTVSNSAFVAYKETGGSTAEYGGISLNMMGNGEITVEGWDTMDYTCLVVANLTDNSDDMNYTYDAEEVATGVPDEVHVFALRPASPNPFTESTSIAYTVPTSGGHVDVTIYDVSGREVRSLVSEWMVAGDGIAVWDGLDNLGRSVGSGVYFARLDIDGLTASGKLMVLK